MRPTDPSDAHLADRAIEIRALKGAVVVLLLTFATLFYEVTAVFAAFAVAYVGYKFVYYRNRVGAFVGDERSIRHPKLELGVLGIGAGAAALVVVPRTLYPDDWGLGGFLSLPDIAFTDVGALLAEPLVPLAWGVAVAPVVAASYAGFQLRHRLLAGLDSDGAVLRATIWEGVARPPVYLLWVGIVSTAPVYELYEPLVGLFANLLGLAAGTTGGFAVVLGERFTAVVVGGLAVPAAVIGTFVVVQRWKYDDATIPEVFGYHGVVPPSRSSHPANAVVPIAVYLGYVAAVFLALDSLALVDLGVVFGVVMSVVVGANVLGQTTIVVRTVSERVADNFDATVTGLLVGAAGLWLFDLLVGSQGSLTDLALTYPILAVPLTDLANRAAGRHAVTDVSEFVDGLDPDAESLDRAAVDRLFVYSRAWNDTLRATATAGLAQLVGITTYRREDALEAFLLGIESDQPELVRSGLQGIAAILEGDPSPETYERLVEGGCRERLAEHLEGEAETRVRATEAAARFYAVGLRSSDPAPDDFPTESRIDRMTAAVGDEPGDRRLSGAVGGYFAAVWDVSRRSADEGLEPGDEPAQKLLGSLLRLADRVDEDARLRIVLAATGAPVPADDERFSVALETLDAESDGGRFLAVHVVRSSMDRRTDRIDPDRLVGLLEDPSPTVRRAAARTVAAFVRLGPDRGARLFDRLVLHLQEGSDDPGPAEADVVRALAVMDVDRLVDHPKAAATIAAYVDGVSRTVAAPAAGLLGSLVAADPTVVRRDAVEPALRAGLTHPSPDVRRHCIEAVVAVVEDSVEAGRPFVRGLGANLDAGGRRAELSVVCLVELLGSFPEDGLEVLPELSSQLGNLTSVRRDAVPFVVRGTTISAVVVDILTEVVPVAPERCELLVEPLTDLATSADGATLEAVFELLAMLSEEFPSACRDAAGTAAAVVEDGRPEVRRDASTVLANVATAHPGAVEPFAGRLVVATDDDNPRVRAAALAALENVCAASPRAVESNLHRIVGRLDDDSATVREAAARLVVTIAEQAPAAVEPAAETADRLRRLQRDPAVDLDAERLQDASTAIQTGAPVDGGDATDADDGEIWTPETGDEMGASGDTNVFEAGDEAFDAGFGEPPEPTGDPADVADAETAVDDDPTDDVEDLETAVAPDDADDDAGGGVEGAETAIEPSGGPSEGDAGGDVEGAETAIEEEPAGDQPDEGVDDLDTAIEPSGGQGDEGGDGGVDDLDTAIEPSDEQSDQGSGEDVDRPDTATEPTGEQADEGGDGDVDDLDTAIDPPGEQPDQGSSEDVDDLDTVIEPSGGQGDEGSDRGVDDLDTAIEPSGDASSGDVDDADTAAESGSDAAGDGSRAANPGPGGDASGPSDGTGGDATDETGRSTATEDVEDLETVVEPGDGPDESSDEDPDGNASDGA